MTDPKNTPPATGTQPSTATPATGTQPSTATPATETQPSTATTGTPPQPSAATPPQPSAATPATQKPVSTRRDLEARIAAKAWRDPAYKARLLQDPKGVLMEELKAIDPSIRLPDALNVSVHEESQAAYHLVLPRNPRDITLAEVAGDDLEALAPQTIIIVVAGIAVAVVNTAAAGNVVAAANLNAAANVNAQVNTV